MKNRRESGFRSGLMAGGAALWLAFALAGCEPSPTYQALQPDPFAAPALEEPVAEPAAPVPEIETPELESADHGDGIPEEIQELQPPPVAVATQSPAAAASDAQASPEGSLELLGQVVAPGTARRLMWSSSRVFEGISAETPVLVVNGRRDGPTMCLTAAIHGDELNGIEMVRRVLHDLEPKKVRGAVIGIPIVNLQGFRRGSRYLPDRRDLNRYFPGNPNGSSAARIAYSLFSEIIVKCDALVDLHTGSFYRTNLPQLRADLRYARIKELTQGFGGMAVLHSVAAPGTLRRAATDAGVPAVTLEAGEPLRLQTAKVSQGVSGIFKLLNTMNIVKKVQLLAPPEPVFYQSTWVRANHGGILFAVVRLGQVVEDGDVLGTVTDPITNEQNLIYAPTRGRILGMALNQVVMPGFAAFRIGMETPGPAEEPLIADMNWAMGTTATPNETGMPLALKEGGSGPVEEAPPDQEEDSEE